MIDFSLLNNRSNNCELDVIAFCIKLKYMQKTGILILALLILLLSDIDASAVAVNYNVQTSGVSLIPTNNKLEKLIMISSDVDLCQVLMAENQRLILEVRPNAWQGNARIFPYEGTQEAGTFWSHFLMASENWLTDKVESEGLRLLSFKPCQGHSKIAHYSGEWAFRDLFISKKTHWLWASNGTIFHYVSTNLLVLSEIPDVSAIWVELMNNRNVHNSVATQVGHKIIERAVHGDHPSDPHFHDLDEFVLDENGWITIYGARAGQKGSSALVPIKSSHSVRPRLYDSHMDNIELHMLDPKAKRTLNKNDTFQLDYLLLVNTETETETWDWVEPKINQSTEVISYIKNTYQPKRGCALLSE